MKILNQLPLGTFDLHIHTTASDGIYTPTEVVEKAKSTGLKTIAITDHDTLDGVKEAMEAAKQLDMTVIPGVEITTRFQGRNIDILGYEIKKIDWLQQKLASFREARLGRALQIIQRFCELGMPITLEEVKKFCGDGLIARPHIAQAIVARGYADTVQEVFDRYLADGKPASVPKKEISLQEGVRMIHDVGGIAVLAHPVYLNDVDLVEEIVQQGLDGIEVWHRNHSAEHIRIFAELADKYQLIVTGGSDFHRDEHQLGRFICET